MLGNDDAPLGDAEDLKADMPGSRGQELRRLLGPFDARDGMRVVHEILKTNIFQFLQGIQTITVKVIKRCLGLVDMHQDESRAFHLLRMFKPQTLRETFDESGLPASELPFQTKHSSWFKTLGKRLCKLNGFLGCLFMPSKGS